MGYYKGTRNSGINHCNDPYRPDNKRPQESRPQNKPTVSLGATIAKVVVGALFIIVGLDDIGHDFSGFLISLVIGGALIAWGLIPYRQAKAQEKMEETERILNTPIKKMEEMDEAERLAKKYYNDK